MTYFGLALDPTLGGFGREVNTNVRGHEYFIDIPTKFGKYRTKDSVVLLVFKSLLYAFSYL